MVRHPPSRRQAWLPHRMIPARHSSIMVADSTSRHIGRNRTVRLARTFDLPDCPGGKPDMIGIRATMLRRAASIVFARDFQRFPALSAWDRFRVR